MNNLIIIKNNEPLTTSLIVAEQLKRKHFSIMKLIQENIISFKKFGVIQLEVEEPKKNTKGGRPEKFISLNEQQLTFLIMMLRVKRKETDLVLSFKEEITKEFFRMRKALLQIHVNRQNQEWLETRKQGKVARKEFTDMLKKLLEMTKETNPDSTYVKKPNLMYSNFTRMIYKNLFDMLVKIKNPRDSMTESQLLKTGVAELTVMKDIQKAMDENKDAKEIYKLTDSKMAEYAELVGKSTIIDLISNNQISMLEVNKNGKV